MPERKIAYISLDEIKGWEENPKDHDIGAIIVSIRRFGFQAPLLVNDGTGVLMAGHGRLEALRQMRTDGEDLPDGVRERDEAWLVPVVRGSSLSPEEAKAYSLVDNRLTETGGWNEVDLGKVLNELKQETDIANLGWTDQNLDYLLGLATLSAGDFVRPTFEELAKENTPSELAKENNQWFYVEFYQDSERFQELLELLGPYLRGNSKHEITGDIFYDIVKLWASNR